MIQPSSVSTNRKDEFWRTTPEIHPSVLSSFAAAVASDTRVVRSESLFEAEACRLFDFFAFRPDPALPEDRNRSTISRVFELREREVGEPSVRKAGKKAAEGRRGVVLRVLPRL